MDVKVIAKATTEDRDFGNGLRLNILLDKMTGSKNLDVGTVTIPPGGKTPMHSRTFEEVIYMLSGEGKIKTENGAAYTLKTGECALIPTGVVHCHANDADEPLQQLYIFAPQAPAETQKALRKLPVIK
jgi:quercetin dioxygenase-like cupin family protein